MAAIQIKTELRPCYIRSCNGDKMKALFHCWSIESDVVAPSLMIGGHPGGTIAYTRGLVELGNGEVISVIPERIQFLDNKFNNYCWDEKGE